MLGMVDAPLLVLSSSRRTSSLEETEGEGTEVIGGCSAAEIIMLLTILGCSSVFVLGGILVDVASPCREWRRGILTGGEGALLGLWI